ncbi:MAG: oxygenase MpaB family protein [Sandaracinobacteroides sp.]
MSPRERIAAEVRAQFAQPGNKPAVTPAPPDARLLPEHSLSFDIHADVTTMMIGGISSLLLQMLHPKALAGVWDFSNFRTDMGGRLRRTAAFIAVTTYGSASDAQAAIARVRRIHSKVEGTLPSGKAYKADDPELLAFVGVTEGLSFLNAWVRYRDPLMLLRDQDRYLAEMAHVSRLLGAHPMPETRREAERFLLAIRPQLKVDARTREVATLIRTAPPPTPSMAPAQRLLIEAGVDLLPGWARRMHGLSGAGLRTPLIRASAGGMGAVLRWALKAPRTADA